MATYKSNLMTYNPVQRGDTAGVPFEVTGAIKLAAGQRLLSGDVLKFARLGQDVSVTKVLISTDGDLDTNGTPTLTASMGFTQALTPSGAVYTVDNKTGTTYPSPATAAAALIADAANSLRTILRAPGVAEIEADELAVFDADGLSGPADVAITVTANSATAQVATTYVRCTLTCVRKEAPQGEWSGDLATAYTNRYTGASSGGLVS